MSRRVKVKLNLLESARTSVRGVVVNEVKQQHLSPELNAQDWLNIWSIDWCSGNESAPETKRCPRADVSQYGFYASRYGTDLQVHSVTLHFVSSSFFNFSILSCYLFGRTSKTGTAWLQRKVCKIGNRHTKIVAAELVQKLPHWSCLCERDFLPLLQTETSTKQQSFNTYSQYLL